MTNPRANSRPQKSRKTAKSEAATSFVYPFSAIVGQDEMKLGLILNVIDPTIGGVLMMGHRGTAKSTAVRALADLLPLPLVVRGCRYNCDPNELRELCADCLSLAEKGTLPRARSSVPVVDLPLGATEDRVCGSIDIERALHDGIKAFEPGLLARANRGFLYIDEVNLLEDHLVDLLLDVAVTGRNKVERENISVEHAARFVLIGSGNPEEGELRPQLLDRFGLYVEVQTENDIERRVAIVERREAFERDPEKFRDNESANQAQLRRRIERARKNFPSVKVERRLLRKIAALCSELKVDGHRGELTIMRSARALAAFAGHKTVSEADVRRVATMALRHRLHRDPLAEQASSVKIEQALDRTLSDTAPDGDADDEGGFHSHQSGGADRQEQLSDKSPAANQSANPRGRNGSGPDTATPAPDLADAKLSLNQDTRTKINGKTNARAGRAGLRHSVRDFQHGRYTRAITRKHGGARVALLATLRAALLGKRKFSADDLRYKQFAKKHGALFIFAIDASGSMALSRINQARGALLRLLAQAYVNRDSVAIIAFKGTEAEVLLPPSRSIVRARRALDALTIGGGTPLSAALAAALGLARRAALQDSVDIRLLLFTDGHANVPLHSRVKDADLPHDKLVRQQTIQREVQRFGRELVSESTTIVVVDTNKRYAADNESRALAGQLGAEYLTIG
jgi:magnesium chelatase subunit D